MKRMMPTSLPGDSEHRLMPRAEERAALIVEEAGPQERLIRAAELFPRSPGRARESAERVMRAIALPDTAPSRKRLPLLAAAALIVALASSLITLAIADRARLVEVRFVLAAADAASVALVADFNGWSPQGYVLKKVGGGDEWEITVSLRKGRSYTYNFVIDGERWVPDPFAPAMLADGFGGFVSSLSL
jgi:hypothetical protein